MDKVEKITITKEISKKGKDTIIIIPKSLQRILNEKAVCRITFEIPKTAGKES